jgi:tetratricopeptide (TPR) repeat protein
LSGSALRGADPGGEAIAKAVRELGSDDFAVRERATTYLWKAGKAAEPALREAIKHPDLEVAHRARALLDKFRWGIYPETPAEIIDLIHQFRSSNRDGRRTVFRQLLDKGAAAFATGIKLAEAEDDPEARRGYLQELSRETSRIACELVLKDELHELETLLETCLGADDDTAFRNYAVYWLLLRGQNDAKIAPRTHLIDQSADAHAAEIRAYWCRTRGDLVGARHAAEKTGKPHLVKEILAELGAWKEIVAKYHPGLHEQPQDIESFGFLAAYQRLAGQHKEFEETIAAIRHYASDKTDDSAETWCAAEALLLNDRTQDGIDVLTRGKSFLPAFELLCAQLRFKEAFALGDLARAQSHKDLLAIEIQRARTLSSLGEREEASNRFTELVKDVAQSQEPGIYATLVEAEQRAGLKVQALAHCAALLAHPKGVAATTELLEALFPSRGVAATVWWKYWRRHSPAEASEITLRRIGELLDGKLSSHDLQQAIDQAAAMAATANRPVREAWQNALLEACEAGGRPDLAQDYLERAQRRSATLLMRLGDVHVKARRWVEAAECYAQAHALGPKSDPVPLYLQGWALVQGGRSKEGQKRMEQARLLPLANEKVRTAFAEALARRGLTAAAHAEYALVLRSAGFDSSYLSSARRHWAREAWRRKDFLGAAAADELAMLECLRTDTSYAKTMAYLAVPHLVHQFRGRGLLAAGQVMEGCREVELAAALLPGEIDLAIAVMPLLAQHGQVRAADALFERAFAVYDQLARSYPRSAWVHNSLAWLAARCRRRLDAALQHASRAVELAPTEAGYWDTLAEVQFQARQPAAARASIQKSVRLNPKSDYYRKQLQRIEAGDPSAEVPDQDD